MKNEKQKKTTREKRLEEAMLDPKVKSKTQAMLKAGYAPSTARKKQSEKWAKVGISPEFQQRIKRSIENANVTNEEVLGSAIFNMRSSMNDLIDEEGFFDLEKARSTGAIDLIKEMEVITSVDPETGARTVRHKIKYESPAAARKEVANYIGLENFAPSTPDIAELAKQFFDYLMAKIPDLPREKAVEAAKAKYPEIDVKLLGEME